MWRPTPKYNNQMLDGLITFKTAEMNEFISVFLWCQAMYADIDPELVAAAHAA
jgi:hypothetical protein